MTTMTPQGQQSCETFGALMKYFGFSDQRLADLTGYTRSQIEWRRRGKTVLDVDDLQRFSEFFGVPRDLLLWAKPDALRWVLDNDVRIDVPVNNYGSRKTHVHLHVSQSPCMHDRPALRLVPPRLVVVRSSAA